MELLCGNHRFSGQSTIIVNNGPAAMCVQAPIQKKGIITGKLVFFLNSIEGKNIKIYAKNQLGYFMKLYIA
jgi:hypothetical protein